MYINCNTGGNEGNKTSAATFTVITSAVRKNKQIFLVVLLQTNCFTLSEKQQNTKQAIFCNYRT
jgi:D-alanyl-D-alanine carboxypeptidase